MGLLTELHDEGATICIVTHDPRYAEYADRKIHMFDGRVVDEETLQRLREEEDRRIAEQARRGRPVQGRRRRREPRPSLDTHRERRCATRCAAFAAARCSRWSRCSRSRSAAARTRAIFSVVDGVLLKPLPYPDADGSSRFGTPRPVRRASPTCSGGLRLSPSMLVTYQEREPLVRRRSGCGSRASASVTGIGDPEQVRRSRSMGDVLQALEVPPLLGRWLEAGGRGSELGRAHVMLTYAYWQRRFGGDPNVVGRTITVDATPAEIVGVMPRGFRVARHRGRPAPPDPVGAHGPAAVPVLWQRRRAAEARRFDRAGERRPRAPAAALARPIPVPNGWRREGRSTSTAGGSRPLCGRSSRTSSATSVTCFGWSGHDRRRAPDRLRERDEPAARARREASARSSPCAPRSARARGGSCARC